jgi:glycosyltransferase involved in cell wall biosynthesis
MLHKVSGIIALGDHFTKETFQTLPHTYPINSAFLEDFRFYENDILKKDFSIARKNFVYIGGGGEVHKGLDLLLEVFHKLPDLNLYICTNFSPGFSKLYENLLSKSPNIHFIGYLPQRSKGFYNLMKNCAFNLHLSCSEGSPGGVIEVLQYGIIPVVSYESNINVENFGFQLQSHSLEEITQMVLKLSKLPAEEARKLALQTRRIGFEKFSTSVFLKNLKHIFKDEIKIP